VVAVGVGGYVGRRGRGVGGGGGGGGGGEAHVRDRLFWLKCCSLVIRLHTSLAPCFP